MSPFKSSKSDYWASLDLSLLMYAESTHLIKKGDV